MSELTQEEGVEPEQESASLWLGYPLLDHMCSVETTR